MPLIQKEKLSLKWSTYRQFTPENVRLPPMPLALRNFGLYVPNEQPVPQGPGVYALFVRTKNLLKPFRVFYIGQAEELKDRLEGHLSDSEPNGVIRRKVSRKVTYFKYTPLAKALDRDKVERALILKYRPACNDLNQIPGSPDVEVDIF